MSDESASLSTDQIDLEVLDAWLRRFCWSDADLAQAAGVSAFTISRVRRSSGRLRRDTRAKLIRALVAKQQADGEFARVADELAGAGS